MKPIFFFLLELSALLGTSAVSLCLDPTNVDYSCELDEDGNMSFEGCDITDDDVDDVASCFDELGRENIVKVFLSYTDLTTLPERIFGGLTALEALDLTGNALTTLPEGIFGDLTAMQSLYLDEF
eukprot:g18049.t1